MTIEEQPPEDHPYNASDVDKALAATFDADTFVRALEFTDVGFQVSFMEKSDDTPNVALQKTMLIALSSDERKIVYMELQDRLQWLISDGWVEMRNPQAP